VGLAESAAFVASKNPDRLQGSHLESML
jgi:hypothetical protein